MQTEDCFRSSAEEEEFACAAASDVGINQAEAILSGTNLQKFEVDRGEVILDSPSHAQPPIGTLQPHRMSPFERKSEKVCM